MLVADVVAVDVMEVVLLELTVVLIVDVRVAVIVEDIVVERLDEALDEADVESVLVAVVVRSLNIMPRNIVLSADRIVTPIFDATVFSICCSTK